RQRNVPAEIVLPARLEPPLQARARHRVRHGDVQLALLRQSGRREVAAPDEGGPRVARLMVTEVQLCVEPVPQEEADMRLSGAELARKPAQPPHGSVVRQAEGQLAPKAVQQPRLKLLRPLR